MRKIISVCLCLLFVICLSGCNNKSSGIKPLTKGITFTADITYYNECYTCDVSVDKNGATDISVLSPDLLKGLSFNFKGNTVTAKYLDLEYKYDTSALPESMACGELYKILKFSFDENAKVNSKNDSFYIASEGGKYKLFLGATGLPLSAENNSLGFSIIFKNVTVE